MVSEPDTIAGVANQGPALPLAVAVRDRDGSQGSGAERDDVAKSGRPVADALATSAHRVTAGRRNSRVEERVGCCGARTIARALRSASMRCTT